MSGRLWTRTLEANLDTAIGLIGLKLSSNNQRKLCYPSSTVEYTFYRGQITDDIPNTILWT